MTKEEFVEWQMNDWPRMQVSYSIAQSPRFSFLVRSHKTLLMRFPQVHLRSALHREPLLSTLNSQAVRRTHRLEPGDLRRAERNGMGAPGPGGDVPGEGAVPQGPPDLARLDHDPLRGPPQHSNSHTLRRCLAAGARLRPRAGLGRTCGDRFQRECHCLRGLRRRSILRCALVCFGWYVLEYDYLPMTDHANKHDLVYPPKQQLDREGARPSAVVGRLA